MSTPLTAADVLAFLETRDPEGLLSALPHIPEDVREQAWAEAGRSLSKRLTATDGRGQHRHVWEKFIRTRTLLTLAIGPPDVLRRAGGYLLQYVEDDLECVLGSRPEPWRAAFTVATLNAWATEPEVGLIGPYWWVRWRLLRMLERSGLMTPSPVATDYLVVMVRGLLFSGSVLDAVVADPELCQTSIWALFEPDRDVQRALLGAERYWDTGNSWRIALVQLATIGLLDPERLDAAARAAADDERIARNHRAWYRKLPELLANPGLLPEPAQHGAPPPGNRLRRSP